MVDSNYFTDDDNQTIKDATSHLSDLGLELDEVVAIKNNKDIFEMTDQEFETHLLELRKKKYPLQKTPTTQPGDHGWIQTYTGIKFYPLSPKIEDINIIDIAHSLSMQCRFLGHIKQFYSVAQHSVLCSRLVDTPGSVMEYDMLGMPQKQRNIIKMYALLHDASEAYLGDVVRPLKHLPEYQFYRDAENKLQTMIYQRFNLFETEPRYIKLIDNKLLVTENYRIRNGLHPDNYYSKENGFNPFDMGIREMDWREAESEFLEDFCKLASSCNLDVQKETALIEFQNQF